MTSPSGASRRARLPAMGSNRAGRVSPKRPHMRTLPDPTSAACSVRCTRPVSRQIAPVSQTSCLSAQQLPSRVHQSSHQHEPWFEMPPHEFAQLPPVDWRALVLGASGRPALHAAKRAKLVARVEKKKGLKLNARGGAGLVPKRLRARDGTCDATARG